MSTSDSIFDKNLAGETIGEYAIMERLGRGGMGVVYRALKLGEVVPLVVAIKYPTLDLSDEALARFRREMEILSLVSDPHLAGIKEAGIHDIDGERRPYFTMEFIFSATLQDVLKRLKQDGQKLPLSAAIHILNEMFFALRYLHDTASKDQKPLRIVHRDVTPDNILIRRPTPAVVLTDFGVASAVTDRSKSPSLVGKTRYMAPETIDLEEQTTKVDIWSAAVVTWEMLHGRRFLDLPSEIEVYKAIKNHDLPAFDPALPIPLVEFLERMLDEDPSERPSAAAAQDELLCLSESLNISFARGQKDLEKVIHSYYGASNSCGKSEAFIPIIGASVTDAAPAPAEATKSLSPTEPPLLQSSPAEDISESDPTRVSRRDPFEGERTLHRPRSSPPLRQAPREIPILNIPANAPPTEATTLLSPPIERTAIIPPPPQHPQPRQETSPNLTQEETSPHPEAASPPRLHARLQWLAVLMALVALAFSIATFFTS